MDINTGFFQNDLAVFHYRKEESKSAISSFESENFYKLLWVIEGNVLLRNNAQAVEVNSSELALISPNEFNERLLQKFPCEFILVSFHSSVFANSEGDQNFLRAFTDINRNEIQIYSSKNFDDDNWLSSLKALKKCIEIHAGRVHVLANVSTIISELCFAFDKINPAEKLKITDNVDVQILDYVNNHYCERISLDIISNRFYVSISTINNIFVRFTGQPFWAYVTSLRLSEANRLIAKKVQLKKVAELCGFGDYSTFYRSYKKHFNHSPKKVD